MNLSSSVSQPARDAHTVLQPGACGAASDFAIITGERCRKVQMQENVEDAKTQSSSLSVFCSTAITAEMSCVRKIACPY